MHEFLHENPIVHAVYHSVVILPLLYFAYVLMEFIEHKTSEKFKHTLQEDRRTGTIIGATIGLLPLCGFADLGAGLYAGRVISLGTVVALFMSTSGETLILIAGYPNKILSLVFLLLTKFVISCLCGFIIDLCLRNRQTAINIHELCTENRCECEHSNIWLSALKHTLPVFCLVLSFNLLIGVLELFGFTKGLAFIIKCIPTFGVVTAAVIGMIPSCTPIILMLSLWDSNILSSAAFLAGLITSAGTGYIVLYKTNKSWKQNIFITLFIFVVGILVGTTFEVSGLLSLLGT